MSYRICSFSGREDKATGGGVWTWRFRQRAPRRWATDAAHDTGHTETTNRESVRGRRHKVRQTDGARRTGLRLRSDVGLWTRQQFGVASRITIKGDPAVQFGRKSTASAAAQATGDEREMAPSLCVPSSELASLLRISLN